MNSKAWRALLARDCGRCLHCGETVALSPNHRINRGMGGSKLRDKPSNLVVLCSRLNHMIEADKVWMDLAIRYGWKLKSWQSSLDEPVYDLLLGEWFVLDDSYGRVTVRKGENEDWFAV